MPTRQLADALLVVVREDLERTGLSVLALSKRTGIPQPTLHRKVHGTNDLSVDQWQAIAVALGYPDLEDLVAAARKV